jgi:hypothetical protein
MVKTERITISGHDFVRSHSDSGYYIHGGMPEGDYAEAIDPAELGRTYTETNIPIEDDTTAEEVVDILLGGAE